MTGVILGIEPPKVFSGTSKGGKPYHITQRRIQIYTGNKSIDVSERLPDPVEGQPQPTFQELPILSMQTFRVTSIRPNGTNLNYDVQIA
jgi:hypothetical protein